ncbi:glycosyltransferase family 20 protein [Pisolithus thermaeus]|nr:glycosyltransferase family 20 protein [Pisolithus croceorrhizus]KAI6161102.1 glycosyltransferase family 20 protein [Pisolithus thermaeus]
MSSFRNHRVIIASLFLPTTAALGESSPPTPDHHVAPDSEPAVPQSNGGNQKQQPSYRQRQPGQLPLVSIVDDLRSRAITPLASPQSDIPNPFTRFVNIASPRPGATPRSISARTPALSNSNNESSSDSNTSSQIPALDRSFTLLRPRKFQTTHQDVQHSARLQRKQSRSSSRRPKSVVRGSNSDGVYQPWHISPNTHCNGGLKNAVDSAKGRLPRRLWVGTLGSNTDGFGSEMRMNIDKRMRDMCDSVPVWIPDGEFESCYDEFCHQVLWPCLHYAVPDAPKTKYFYESASFKQYRSVNQRFADVIVENYHEGDIIWVNDYHLLLLPGLLRSHPKTALAPIGFFLHVAFPSSEIFRCLSVRDSLLKGVLGADLVGFQTANYARHFRQTVSRILAYESLPKGIQVEGPVAPVSTGGEAETEWRESAEGKKTKEKGRFVDVGVFPMGIDVNSLREKKRHPEVEYWVQLLRQRYAGMKLIVGRDKLDEIQGVRHKIEAFEHFLKTNPEFQGKVVLIQVALQTTESNELAGGVSDVVARINAAFSTLTYQPVVFLHVQEVTFSQYLALLTVADAFMVTSLREGMALRTHEYVECQEERKRALILSEFTGTYSYSGFRSCFAVNPYDTRGTAKAIYQALTMSDEEAASRWQDLHNHVVTQTAQTFVTSFLTRCLRAHTEHASLSIDPSLVPALDLPRLIPKYRHSTTRLVFVDLEGCLWIRDMSKSAMIEMMRTGKGPMVEPPEATIRVLEKMAGDPKNEIWVLSGLPVKGALERLAERVPSVGIVAENGCFVKTRKIGNKSDGQSNGARWINMVANLDFAWKVPCIEILNYFTERTPGSFVEERATSVVWRFWTGPPDSTVSIDDDPTITTSTSDTSPTTTNAATSLPSSESQHSDRSWARRQAAEAQNHIFDSLGERYGLRIIPGQNSFLVLPNNISRSTAVGTILHPGGPACSPLGGGAGVGDADYDGYWSSVTIGGGTGRTTSSTGGRVSSAAESTLVLAIGGDEKLLRRLNELDDAETVSTSRRGTDAKWKLDPREVLGVLETLGQVR